MSNDQVKSVVSGTSAIQSDSCRPAMSGFLDQVFNGLCAWSVDAARAPDSVSFENYYGITRILVTPQDIQTVDGNSVLETVSICTDVSAALEQTHIDDRDIVLVNNFASSGALIRNDQTGALEIVSLVTNYEGFDEALELYCKLVVESALTHSYGLLAATGQPGLPFEDSSGMKTLAGPANKKSRWGEREFRAVAKLLNRIGCYSNASAEGLTTEIPWDRGAVSSMLGDETCLFTMESGMPHPTVGGGLFFKLELPRSFEEAELIHIANKLNQIEVGALDLPPFIGAWCSKVVRDADAPASGRISFIGFWPEFLSHPGSEQNLAVWMSQRAVFAREVIENQRY